ncbi:MAG: hypothetical protein LUQ07_08095 [Methanospirillum sp.]|nr:hypothetical protein [Methanospirillum sp.]
MKNGKVCFITLLFMLMCITGSVQAYIITINAPETVVKGSPLIVSGTTTFPEDSYFDLVLFYSKYTASEITRKTVIVDPTQQFRIDFDTRDLEKGQYKVEVYNIISDNENYVESQLGSSSVIRRVIQVTDRSGEITITSPETQPLSQALTISGRMKDIGDGVLTLRIFGPDQYTNGPEQVRTSKGYTGNDGEFSTTIKVPGPGEYQVSISDKNGYIGEYPFTVTGETPEETETVQPTASITQTPAETPDVTPEKTIPETPSPTPTKSPLSITPVIFSIVTALLALYVTGTERRKNQ